MPRLLGFTVTVALLTPSLLRADVAPFGGGGHPRPLPTPPPARPEVCAPVEPKARVVLGAPPDNDRQTHIVLPARLVGDMRRYAPARPAEKHVGQAPSRPAVIVAGLALAGAFALGGLWLVRKPGKRLAGGLGMLGALGVVVLGVSGCPPFERKDVTVATRLQPPQVRADGTLAGEALLEIDAKRDAVMIAVDRDRLSALPGTAPAPREP
jgi:hypothetical protein